MQAIPLARANTVLPLIRFLEQSGGALRLVRERLPAETAGTLLPLAHAGAVFEEAARVAGRADLGLRLGLETDVDSYGEWGRLAAGAPTLGAFLEAALHAYRRFNSGYRLWTVRRGDDVWLHLTWSRALRRGRGQISEFAMALWLRVFRHIMGPDWRPAEIHLEGEPPPHAERIAALATRRVCFRQPGTAFVFPRACLAIRRAPGAPLAIERETLAPPTEFAASARLAVASLLQLGVTDLPTTAEAIGMSERSFQRHLAEVGLSFSGLVETARFEAARRLLADPARRVIDVSTALGYADSANFTRAFRRWSGVSPQLFRAAHGAAGTLHAPHR